MLSFDRIQHESIFKLNPQPLEMILSVIKTSLRVRENLSYYL